MKDIFNAHQRFSIRKYSFGAASVLLGTVFLAQAQVAQAEVETGDTSSTISSEENVSAPLGSTTVESTSNQSQAPQAVTRPSTSDSLSETALEIKEVEAPQAEVKATADKSGLQAKIAELKAAIKSADKSTDSSALAFANKAVAGATAVLNNAEVTQAEVDAQVQALSQATTVVKEASNQAKTAQADKKATEEKASQPAEKTALEKTVSEAVVTNRLANNFVEKEAKEKEVAVDLTDAVKAAVANNEANITASNQVLADKEATTDALKNATQQLQSSIEAVYVSLRKAGKEEFEVALAAEDYISTQNGDGTFTATATDNNPSTSTGKDIWQGSKLTTGNVLVSSTGDISTLEFEVGSSQRDGSATNPGAADKGRVDYPLTPEKSRELAAEASLWNGKLRVNGTSLNRVEMGSGGAYEYLATHIYHLAYEQGVDRVYIPGFKERFRVTDAARAQGWTVTKVDPRNIGNIGLTYDAASDSIQGVIQTATLPNGVYDIRTDVTFTNTITGAVANTRFQNLRAGWFGVQDTLPPKIETNGELYLGKVGEAITTADNSNGFDIKYRDLSASRVFSGAANTTFDLADGNQTNIRITYADSGITGISGVMAVSNNAATLNVPGLTYKTNQGSTRISDGNKIIGYNGTALIAGTPTEAGIFYVTAYAKDFDLSTNTATNNARWFLDGQEARAGITLAFAPKVEVLNVETYSTEVPITISNGATGATITMPDGTVTVLENQNGKWVVIGDGTTNASVVAGEEVGEVGQQFNLKVSSESTAKAGVDNITVYAKTENVQATLIRNVVTLKDDDNSLHQATFNSATGRYELPSDYATVRTERDNGAYDVTQREVYVSAQADGSVNYYIYAYNRTFDSAGKVTAVNAVTRTETVYAKDNTVNDTAGNGMYITVSYDKATNQWTATDGSVVTAVKDVDRWNISTTSGYTGVIKSTIVESTDKATIINSKPTATSTSYESTLNAKVDLRKAAEAAVAIADKEDDALKASNPTGELASKVTNITRITVTKPSGAQKVYDTVKAAAEYDLAADYTLDEVGVYTVKIEVLDSNTNLVDGTTVGATTSGVDHGAGSSNAETTYTITVKAAIVGNNANSEDIQGAKQTGQPTFTFDNTEKSPINQGTKVYTLETTTATDSTGKAIGLYAIDSNTGVVTFTPNNDYVGTPTPAKVTLTVTFGNDTTGQPITAQATAEYQPVVKPVTPTAVASETTGPQGKAQTSEIKFDAADSDNTTVNFAKGSVEIDATTTKSVALDKDTVVLLDANGNKVQSVTVYEADGTTPQGTYTLDKATNQITFQPTPEFTGKATPVNIEILDVNGTPARTTYTPTVTPVTLSKEDAKSTAVQGLTQTGKPTFKTSDEKVAIKTTKLIDPTTGNETDNPVVIPNVGTYTMQADGTVKFVPEPGYVTTDNNKTLVNVRATDENGKTIDAAYEPTVTPIEVTTTPAQTIDIQGAVQNGTPTFELPATVKDVEVKDGTKVAEITGYKLIDPKDNKATEETSVTVDNVGKYTIDPSTGAVKFEPVATYTGKPTPIKVEATVTVKNEDDKTATFTAETTYTPEVVPVTPTAKESATAGKQGQKQTSNIVFDTVDRDATTLHFDKGETSRVLNADGTAKSVELDKDTVVLLDANGAKVTSVTVYEADGTTPQGTYTLTKDAAGNPIIEFQPTPEFTGVAKAVDVEILDLNGTPARTIYTPTVIAEDGSVVVEYIDKDTKTPIVPTETVVNNEKVTTPYTTTPKSIPGYRLVEVKTPEGTTKDDENKVSGKVTNGTTTITYVYEKIKQKATLSYFDITTGQEVAITSAPTENVEGESGKAIDFANKATTIEALLKAGYEVTTDEFQAATTSDRLFDNDESKDQPFKVLVKQRILPVTPTTPNVEPGVPVTPTDPANWPESVKDLQKQLTKEVTRTIKYRYISRTGEVADVDVVQTVKFTREAKVNIVTGAIVEYTDWKQEGTAGAVTSPVKTNYSVDRAVVEAANITADSENSEEYVIYTPLAPTATPAVSTDIQGKTQEGTPTYKHADGTELKPSTSNPARFVGTTNTTVPATKDGKQVGTFTLDPNSGKVTFVPNKDFVGTVDPVGVEVTDPTNKEVAKSTYTPTVTPVTPTGVDTTSTGPKGQVQNGTPTFVPGHKDVPMDNTVPATFEDGTTTKVVPGEGTYVVDPSGKVTFTPEPNYVGTTNGVTVVRKDINGTEAKAKYTPTVYDVKADQQVATITYKDSKGNILGKVDIVQGDSNTAINYSTAARIKALQDQGYKLVSDNFTKQGGQTFDNDTKVIQEFVVVVSRPTTSFITKDNKEIPGYPTKDGELPKETIDGYHFIKTTTDKDGNITHVYNKITTSYVDGNSRAIPGHPTEDGDKPAKPIPGYHFTGKTTTDSEGNITHIYNKITTSYVTENSNPIPGYPTKDGELPKESIPGYEFVRTVVDPETGNITHVYKRVEAPAKKVITSFVDQDGNILRPSKDGQHPAEAIPGYVLVDTKTDADGNITHIYAKLKPTTPTQPATPATPTVQPTSVKPAPASAKQLPNTGTENHAGLAALGLAGLLGGLGLISRKKKED